MEFLLHGGVIVTSGNDNNLVAKIFRFFVRGNN